MGLQRRAVRGVVSYGSVSFVRFVLSFSVQIAFARLLVPSAFGILTLAAAILTGLTLLGRWGVSEAIVQETEHKQVFSTLFWLRAGFSVFMIAFVGLFVLLVQGFFEGAVLSTLLLLTAGKAISSLSTPFSAIMEREFKLFRLATLDLVALILGAVIGLYIVLVGYGVWGLVGYYMLYDALFGAGVIILSPKYPAIAFNRDTARWFVGFARSLLFSKSLSAVESRADDFTIGMIGGSAVLGLYTIAYRLTTAFSTVFQATIRKGILPTFSRIQDSDELSERGLAFLLRMQTYLVVPLYIFVAATATDIITLLFGEQWTNAGPVLRVLAPAGIIIPLVASMRQYYYTVGRGALVLRIQVIYLSAFALGLLVLVPFYGGIGGAIATVGAQFLGFGLFLYVLRSGIGLSPLQTFSPAIVAGTITAGGIAMLHTMNYPWQLRGVLDSIPSSRLLLPILAYGIATMVLFYLTLYLVSSKTVGRDANIIRTALLE